MLRASNKPPIPPPPQKKPLDQKLTPKVSHVEFPSNKNSQKVFNDITDTKNRNPSNGMFVFVSVITTLKCWFTPWDTLQTIDTILIILLTDFMKKMQCNALNIKTVAKQVWFYFIRGTKRPGYAGIISDIISSYPKKYLPKFSYPKKSRNRKFQTPQNF